MKAVYTDGSCRKNKKGGWAAVTVVDGEVYHVLEGTEQPTTNNRMELTAILAAINHWRHQNITIYSDSKYCTDGIKSWMHDWKRNEWRGSSGELIKNHDLWLCAHSLVTSFSGSLKIKWVKGHSINTGTHSTFNKLADYLAKEKSE